MILARRILPFFSPLVLVIAYSGLIFRPLQWSVWVTTIVLVLVLTMGFMVEWRFFSAQYWGLSTPVFLLAIGGTSLLFFISQLPLQIVLAAVIVVLTGMYIEDVFVYRYQSHRYSKLSLPRLGFFICIFALFGLFSAGFALWLIELLEPWQLTIAALVVGFTYMVYLLWSYQVWSRERVGIALVGALLIAQLVWVLQFWPHAFFILGAVVAAFSYTVSALIELHERDSLTRPMLIRFTVVGAVTIVAALATSQWS